jgi:hypothetical protein
MDKSMKASKKEEKNPMSRNLLSGRREVSSKEK